MFEWLRRRFSVRGWVSAIKEQCKLVRLGDWTVLLYYNYLDEFVDASIQGANNKVWYKLKVKRTGEWSSETFGDDLKEVFRCVKEPDIKELERKIDGGLEWVNYMKGVSVPTGVFITNKQLNELKNVLNGE